MKLNINLTSHVYRGKKCQKARIFTFHLYVVSIERPVLPKYSGIFSIKKKTAFKKQVKTCHSSWATNITRPQRNKTY